MPTLPRVPSTDPTAGDSRARSRTAAVTAVLLALTLVAGACSDGTVTESRRSPARGESDPGRAGSAALDWGTCTDELAAMASLQCATLEVPLDPTGETDGRIELALARKPATGAPEDRIGSLVFNPGGPGGSGIEFLAGAATAVPDELAERFDLVSFDPRGVGASSPVRCVDDRTKDEQLQGDLSPDTDEELQQAIEDSREFLEGCQERSGEALLHMSTADVAADLDRIREALGDERLSYVGLSYGTSIGATYATLFPDKVRALVLDGAVSPDPDPEEELLAQGRGFERTLASFVGACNADAECALGPDAAAALAAARAGLEADPVRVEDPTGERIMGPDLFDLALATALYDTTVWGTTASAIAQLRDGGAQVLFTLVDRQIGRQPDGTYDNSSDAQSMVSCADQDERPSVEEGRAIAERVAAELPTFGDAIAWGALGCLDWPEPANPLPEITGEGAAPILVIGTLGDPATPHEWAEQMAAALDSATLLTYEGDGHTAFLRGGACIEDAVVAYLVDGEVPPDGTSCPAQEESVSFGGLRDEVISQFTELGLPEAIAACVVDGVIAEVGAAEFDRLVLTNDVERLPALVQEQSLTCAMGGG